MQTPYLSSYVIPYYHSPQNLKNLKDSLRILQQDPRMQIIIVESGKFPRIKNMELKTEYVFVESEIWNLGWLYNMGFRKTKTDILFFAEFSFLPRLDVIHNIIGTHADRQCIYGQTNLIRLDKQQTSNKAFDFNLPSDEKSIEGISFYTREGFMSCGGYDENVFGDDLYEIQDKRNRALLNIGIVNGSTIFKLDTDKPSIEDELLEYSKKHLDKVIGLDPNRMVNYMKSQSKKNGYSNKYKKLDLMLT